MVGTQGQARKPNCLLALELRIKGVAKKDVSHVTGTCQGSGLSEPGVKLQGAVEQSKCLGQPFAGHQPKLRQSSEIKIIGGEVFRSPPRRHCKLCFKQSWPNGRDNCDRYFVLQGE